MSRWICIALLALAAALAGCERELRLFDPPGEGIGFDASIAPVDPAEPDARVRRAEDAGIAVDPDPPGSEDDGSPSIARTLAACGQTCALQQGALWCWGDNRYGQRGGSGDSRVPARIEGGPFSEVCTGEEHTCALRTDGVALCWGANTNGELGVGDRAPRTTPTPVTVEPGERFVSIACGGKTTCGISANGELTCWGDNTEAQLGALAATASVLPVRVAPGLRVGQASVGQAHVCAVALGGGLWCWGRNSERQAGDSDAYQVRAPLAIDPANAYLQVSAGQRHSCAIRRDGRLVCWGDQQVRLLGSDPTAATAGGPRPVGSDADYAQVSVAWFHSCARKRDGSIWCWGRNAEGQLGTGDFNPRNVPTRVFGDNAWGALAVGHLHSCAMDPFGTWCWGGNDQGQLGTGDNQPRVVPTYVEPPLVF